MSASNESTRPHFSLRTLLILIMLAAAYLAGWVSHREWNKQNVEETVLDAARRVGGPVTVDSPQGSPELLMLRGKRDEVEEMEGIVREIDAAARK